MDLHPKNQNLPNTKVCRHKFWSDIAHVTRRNVEEQRGVMHLCVARIFYVSQGGWAQRTGFDFKTSDQDVDHEQDSKGSSPMRLMQAMVQIK